MLKKKSKGLAGLQIKGNLIRLPINYPIQEERVWWPGKEEYLGKSACERGEDESMVMRAAILQFRGPKPHNKLDPVPL